MRAALGVALLLWLVAAAGAIEVTESNGVHYFPDGCRQGVQLLSQIMNLADYQRDGTHGYCFDCIAGTAPAQQGTGCGTFPNFPTGACGCNWFRQQGVVICLGSGRSSCTPFICPLGDVQIGVDANCGPVCQPLCEPGHALNPIGGPCSVDTDCCFGFCVDGICSLTMTTTTSVTTSTGATTTTTAASTTTTTAASTTTTTAASTTTTTAASTTTTTAATTTTTTTLPASVTFLWSPGPGETQNGVAFAADGTLFCNAWVPPVGIDSATTLVFQVGLGSTSGSGGVAIYNADGSSRVTSTGGISIPLAAVITTTTGAFTLTAGTNYQVCFCDNQSSGSREWYVARNGTSTGLEQIQRAFATSLTSVATNTCSGGSPPLTTGTLVASSHPPLNLLIATDTP